MNGSVPTLDVAGHTDTGLKRERNEDCFDIRLPNSGATQDALFLVADGIGGLSGGDIASRAAVEQIALRYFEHSSKNGASGDITHILHSSLEETNAHIRDEAEKIGLLRIGSTIAGLLLRPTLDTMIFNVGDTRVYRVRNGSIDKLSRDQTLSEQQLEQGLITPEEARSTRNSPITAFLGQPAPITPAYFSTQALVGDTFVLCSDGLWNVVDEDEIHRVITSYPANFAVKRLVNMTLDRGAPDNVTVIVVRVGRPPRTGPLLSWIAEKLNWV